MPEPRPWHLVVYDVSEHKVLSAWGKPVQYSVFRVRGTGRELAHLRFELTGLIARRTA